MSALKKNVKKIIESSKSEEELLNNLDSLNRPLTEEELNLVTGGGCKLDACGSIAEGGFYPNPSLHKSCPGQMQESCISGWCSYCQWTHSDPSGNYYYCSVTNTSFRDRNR